MNRFPLPEDYQELIFPTPDEVILVHDNFALLTGGAPGLLKVDDLHGAVGRPQQAALYDETADLVKIAAYYWHGISISHGFVDGNKRTGFLTAVGFLNSNGIAIEIEENLPGEMVDAWMDNGEFEIPLLEDFLRRHASYLD